MATIKDVAERVGCSVSLVSHYLNGRPGVGKESKRLIEEAIRELHFRPSETARSLVLQRSNSIGVIVSHISNPFLFELLDGIDAGAGDYNIVYASTSADPEKRKRYFDFFRCGRADALIVYGGSEDAELVEVLRRINYPVILVENDLPDMDVSKVLVDNKGGAKEATEYLLSLGHRNLLFVSCYNRIQAVRERREAFEETCRANGVEPHVLMPENPDEQISRHDLFELARTMMLEEIEKNGIPDAVFASGDILGYGVVEALKEKGYRVPEDVSVIGFDDEPGFEFGGNQRLTTMRQPLKEVGELAVQSAIARMKGEDPKCITVPTKLIDRGTCIRRK